MDGDPEEPQAGLWDAIMTCFFIDTVSKSFLGLQSVPDRQSIVQEHRELLAYNPSKIGTWRCVDQSRCVILPSFRVPV